MATTMHDRRPQDLEALMRLMTWLSPSFPIGAFSYSHGLEWAVQSGAVVDGETLEAWLMDLLVMGSAWSDAVLFAESWHAVSEGEPHRLAAVAELAEALAPTAERHNEAMEQGAAFLRAAAAWPVSCLMLLNGRAPYPVAVAAVAAGHRIGLEAALAGFLHAFAANQVSAAIRIVPLGQSHGLAVLARTESVVLRTAARAASSSLDDLGSATVFADIACMNHETQYSRLFRS